MAQSKFWNNIVDFFIRMRKQKNGGDNKTMDFSKAKTIAILYEASKPGLEFIVSQYIEKLEKEGKDVFSVEFYPKDYTGEYKLKELNHFLMKEKDLSFFKLPNKYIINSFCDKEYDILMNISLKDVIQFHYLSAVTKARLKLTLNASKYLNLYDFELTSESEDLNEKLKSLDSYLRQISKK